MRYPGSMSSAAEERAEALGTLYRQLKGCQECVLSETREETVPGEGCPEARLMLVGLSPGEEEERRGRMFVGRAGQVLERLLRSAGVRREELYMTNLLKCRIPKNGKPRAWEVERCGRYLEREIEILKPGIIVPLGYYATRHVLTSYGVSLPPERREYQRIFGNLYFSEGQKLFPLPHPASVLYRPDYEAPAQGEYDNLNTLRAPCRWHSVCPMRRHYEAGRLDRHWIELYCRGLWNSCVRYQMEERGEYHPDWMLPNGEEDLSLK